MIELKIIACVLIGYLLGSSNLAYYLSKAKKIDLRGEGSGNYGTSNAFMLLGAKLGVLVAIHDIGKAVISVVLAMLLFPDVVYLPAVAGVSAVIGHIFPFYIKFKGGKGFAPYIGLAVALNWKVGLIIVAVAVALILISNYMVFGTMATILSLPISLAIHNDWIALALASAVTIIIILKHIENFVKIKNGTEFKVRDVIFKKKSEESNEN